MVEQAPYPPGGRRVERPSAAKPCTTCGELVGRGYPDCVICAARIDDLWWADWRALLHRNRIQPGSDREQDLARQVLADTVGRHPWTCTDWALWLTSCTGCGGRLGSGERGCVDCAAADADRWAWDFAARPNRMTDNEHALRVCVAALRAPHRHRASALTGWRLALPFLLVGDVPTRPQAQRIRLHVLAGRAEELAGKDSYVAMADVADLPWR